MPWEYTDIVQVSHDQDGDAIQHASRCPAVIQDAGVRELAGDFWLAGIPGHNFMDLDPGFFDRTDLAGDPEQGGAGG